MGDTIERTPSGKLETGALTIGGTLFVGGVASLAAAPNQGLFSLKLSDTLTVIWLLVALCDAAILFHTFRVKMREFQPPPPEPHLELEEWAITVTAYRQAIWFVAQYLREGDLREAYWLPAVGQAWQLPVTHEKLIRKHYDALTGAVREFGLVTNRKQGATGQSILSPAAPTVSTASRVSGARRKQANSTPTAG